jgi:hypothetical protein
MAAKQAHVAQNNKNRMSDRPTAAHSIQPKEDFVAYLKEYAREKPEIVALWCFGAGFVLGWKLKFW